MPKGETRRVAFNIISDLGIPDPLVVLPPLYMQHNPQTWSQSFKKIITRYSTFSAFVEEHWGDELDTITASATTGGFIHEDTGYDTVNRSKTKPFHKFQDILDIYKNNGNQYNNLGQVVKKGSIVVFFDPGTYIGHFENFNYVEDASNPYIFKFDFTFKVRKSFTGF